MYVTCSIRITELYYENTQAKPLVRDLMPAPQAGVCVDTLVRLERIEQQLERLIRLVEAMQHG